MDEEKRPLRRPTPATVDNWLKDNVKSVTVRRVEGDNRTDDLEEHTFETVSGADRFINEQNATAPTDGSYHKMQLTLNYKDGDHQTYRIDMKRGEISSSSLSGFMYQMGTAYYDRKDLREYQAHMNNSKYYNGELVSASTRMLCEPGETYVQGYTKEDGTFVDGYCRAAIDERSEDEAGSRFPNYVNARSDGKNERRR